MTGELKEQLTYGELFGRLNYLFEETARLQGRPAPKPLPLPEVPYADWDLEILSDPPERYRRVINEFLDQDAAQIMGLIDLADTDVRLALRLRGFYVAVAKCLDKTGPGEKILSAFDWQVTYESDDLSDPIHELLIGLRWYWQLKPALAAKKSGAPWNGAPSGEIDG